MKSKLFSNTTSTEESSDRSNWEIRKNDDYLKDIDTALSARLASGCIDNDIEMDTKYVASCIYGKYKKDKLQELINKGYDLFKETKQQYKQKHGPLRIKQ